jgi:hypothetical protein
LLARTYVRARGTTKTHRRQAGEEDFCGRSYVEALGPCDVAALCPAGVFKASIGDKLAYIYAGATRARGVKVTIHANIGERQAHLAALRDGSIGAVPEYSGELLDWLDTSAARGPRLTVPYAVPALKHVYRVVCRRFVPLPAGGPASGNSRTWNSSQTHRPLRLSKGVSGFTESVG